MDIAKNLAENISSAQSFTLPDLVIKNVSYLNVFTESFEKADIAVKNGVIVGVGDYEGENEIEGEGKTLVPGFIDGHTHLESSVISPKQYCKAVVPHGTVAVVTDPHEITNVLGKTGFDYIYEETKNLPLDVYLMVPSCVPATPFDESGADLTLEDMEEMLSRPRVLGLAEMMNFPGVIYGDKNVIAKLELARKHEKLIDGHAPALSGKQLSAYVGAGIGTDHECVNEAEAVEKIALGQYIMIREGTAGKNLEGLKGLFKRPYCHRCMLATDDKHPGELSLDGHIDYIIRRAISLGADPVCAYKMASFNAAAYFGLKTKGAIAPGFEADFVLLDDVKKVKINSVYKAGVRIDNRVGELVDAIDEENPHRAQACDTVHIA
ncbi:MAG: amidohydrolase family protein, partial [Oscillospiraceae bacterium]|nr:amidohydrolase family protein [Oscillospiraceae bacterium]